MAVCRNKQDRHVRPEKQQHQDQKCQTAKGSLRDGKRRNRPSKVLAILPEHDDTKGKLEEGKRRRNPKRRHSKFC
jgi:hypothetical protein